MTDLSTPAKLDAIKGDVSGLNLKIQSFQKSPGTLSPPDRTAFNEIAKESADLVTCANAIAPGEQGMAKFKDSVMSLDSKIKAFHNSPGRFSATDQPALSLIATQSASLAASVNSGPAGGTAGRAPENAGATAKASGPAPGPENSGPSGAPSDQRPAPAHAGTPGATAGGTAHAHPVPGDDVPAHYTTAGGAAAPVGGYGAAHAAPLGAPIAPAGAPAAPAAHNAPAGSIDAIKGGVASLHSKIKAFQTAHASLPPAGQLALKDIQSDLEAMDGGVAQPTAPGMMDMKAKIARLDSRIQSFRSFSSHLAPADKTALDAISEQSSRLATKANLAAAATRP